MLISVAVFTAGVFRHQPFVGELSASRYTCSNHKPYQPTEGSRSVVGYPFCRLDRAASSRKPNDDEQERRQAGGDHEMMLNLFSDDTPFFTQKITGGDKGAGPNQATRVRVEREDRRFEL